ncbi:outer-membrane receptor for ferric coprogen and ferric-rhodotorulic acid [Pseudomonas citronellolis]|uniref:Outer-membrane receptor for ferric coprogen and ferric-rhodotorulic acid n=1 Tax=Pseudomonas citronellolis TaxID=53408 RepID=A0AAQ1HS35_9PSED|nr:TonB-dependent receptor [Pseudomonas citronellolis]TGC27893.1 TonB-dependent siderophore receptor [Pseudomonas citronellolis]SFC42245.1 outer-membrane receptor for ferric coprogen and ferric-rhodotorulic acid [Pseudomonas citronellolis]
MASKHRRHSGTRRFTHLALAAAIHGVALGCAGLALAPSVAMAAEAARDYAIGAGALSDVLARFAASAGVQLVFDPARLAGRNSPGLKGRYTVEQGFQQLLRGSGLQLVQRGAGIYALQDAGTALQMPPETVVGKGGDTLAMSATVIQANANGAGAPTGYQQLSDSSTTRLGLTPRETPQGVTTLSRQQLDDFNMNSVKDALRSAPSVTVEQYETDRTNFTSRGFDINNFEYDGIGSPFSAGLLSGDLDLAEYEQVDILHGANGLMSGTGNPSATVNFIRKRPTYTPQAQVKLSVGSWGTRRIDLDASGPLTDSGNVRGRFIYANETGNSYLDRYSHEKNVLSGMLAFDLTEADTLTVGFSDNKSNSNGSSWGALPLTDQAGNLIHYSRRGANIGQDWTYWDVHTQRAFVELAHDFGGGWKGKLNVTGVDQSQQADMYYLMANDADTPWLADPSHSHSGEKQLLGEAQVSGPFSLGGRQHDLTLGVDYGRSRHSDRGYYNNEDEFMDADLGQTLSGAVPRPSLTYTNDTIEMARFTDRQKSVYAGTRLNLTDQLHWILGARMLSVDSDGTDYGSARDVRIHGEVTPYTGVVYDLDEQYSLYASYTKIFNPQYVMDAQGKVLDPLEGKSYEAGIKGSLLDDQLSVSAALFKTDQRNVAEATDQSLPGGETIYNGEDFKSRGAELEASGQLAPGLQLQGGYTYVHIEDPDGHKARQYVPTHSLRSSLTYQLPGLPQAKVGTRVSWQSAIQLDDDSRVRQNAYALVDLMGSYDIDKHWSASLNLNNLTNRKYLMSLYSGGSGFYGPSRNVTASVSYNF